MPIIEPTNSLATNNSNSFELYFYRKAYKNNALTGYDDIPGTIVPGVAEFWYDRHLYGKLDRKGNIVIIRDDFLSILQTATPKTFFALNFVAVAFNAMREYFNKETQSGRIPNTNTVFRDLNPTSAWDSVYDKYHEYMGGVYDVFVDYLKDFRREDKINNFDDFAQEFFIFTRNMVTTTGFPITFSGFVSNPVVNSKTSGLIIDLFNGRASNDPTKIQFFIQDNNFQFLKHAATKHGFVIDKNIPWRLTANLSSDYMKLLMESPAFNVTYEPSSRQLFDIYYTKTYTLDMVFLRKYMYDIYQSLINSRPAHSKYKYCNNLQKTIHQYVTRLPLTPAMKEQKYGTNFWLERICRFRLLELKHDLAPSDIQYLIKNTQSLYRLRGELAALKFLHNNTKKFFLNTYNKNSMMMKAYAPQHAESLKDDKGTADSY